MSKKHAYQPFIVISALILLVVLFSMRAATPTQAQTAVKIMALGDSITGGTGCWRAILWSKLQSAGYTNFTPVGTMPPVGCSQGSDGNHEGHGGYLATNIASQNQLPPWLSATTPDVVIMHLATNDVWSSLSNDAILAAYTTLVGQMRANNPNMKIIVAQIIALNPSGCAECNQRAISLNAAIPVWAVGLSTSQSPIIVVDQWTGFNTSTDTTDGVHPNDAGFQKMADKWYPAVASVLSGNPLPTATLVPPTITPTLVPSNLVSFNKPVTVSSVESANGGSGNTGAKAVDGSMTTRWASEYSDPQWIYVDLGSSTAITTVDIIWEPAYASQYKLQVSNNASTWTDVFTESAGNGGTDTITVNQTARYIRMYGTQRATSFGYSIWEFRVWSGAVGPTNTPTRTFTASPVVASLTPTLTQPVVLTATPTRTRTSTTGPSPTRTRTPTTGGPSPTRTPTPIVGASNTPTNTSLPPATNTPTTPPTGGTCTPVTSTITVPFSFDGAGTFCWQASSLGGYINSWNTGSVSLNGVNVTNIWVGSGSYPAKIGGFYYVSYNSAVAWGHFEAK